MICAACDKPMKSQEASGFFNQHLDSITVSLNPENKDALPVHICHSCKKELKACNKILHLARVAGKAPMVSIR